MFVYSVVLLGGKGVRVSTPFMNAFQKKKDFLIADFAEDMELANTYPSEFFNTLEVNGMPSKRLSIWSSSLGVRGLGLARLS